ncbi:hypothetical protein Q3C19_15165 [Bacteroides sp. ET489]|uniref:helix-turn-helix domain-containing protein n=1 Tax=Bacteroides TaxID=816 RepID=UPI00135667AF|nr:MULTISPECIES: hypothetical protein [Bacteroides]MDO3391806.1 hypothetical protein [Bacteroides sp. ET489]
MKKIRFRSITIYLLTGAVLAVMVGYMRTSYRHETYQLKAGEILTKALQQEMLSRDTANHLFSSNLTESLNEELPDTVRGRIRSIHGIQSYVVPRTKYYDNISASKFVRDIHSYLILESVLKADSLYKSWSRLLSDSSVCNHNIGLRLKQPLSETTSYVPDSITVTRYDSLCTRYIGSYCEAEITAFSDISWYDLLEWTDWGLIFLAGGGVPCLCLFFVRLRKLYKSLSALRKTKTKIQEEGVKPRTRSKNNRLYNLGMEIYFDAEQNVLCNENNKTIATLSATMSNLLECFLKAPHHTLSKHDIYLAIGKELETYSLDSFYKMIGRLRDKLESISPATISNDRNGSYQLVLPSSIDKQKKMNHSDENAN